MACDNVVECTVGDIHAAIHFSSCSAMTRVADGCEGKSAKAKKDLAGKKYRLSTALNDSPEPIQFNVDGMDYDLHEPLALPSWTPVETELVRMDGKPLVVR